MQTAPRKNKTILIADDEQFVTIAYKAGLENAGYDVFVAADGNEALDHVTAHRPDAVILDIIMPGMNGFEVLQVIKGDRKLARIPVIIFSNLSQQSDKDTAQSYGADCFLVKAEVSFNDVLMHLERLLEGG